MTRFIGLVAIALATNVARAEVTLHVEPSPVVLDGALTRVQFLVRAAGNAEEEPDLTHQAAYRSSRPDVAAVGPTGQIVALADGDAAVTVTAGGGTIVLPVTV